MSGATLSLLAAARAGGSERRRLGLAVLLGFGAVASAGALLLTSGYLITRAAQRPDILTLTVAIVGVRAFAITRSLLRYGERLSSHDAALRLLGRVRASFFRRLAPLVPGDLGGPRSGDLLSRFVGDVDALQDLYLRALAPPVVAALVIAASALTAWLILPAAAPIVFVCLLLASIVVPGLAATLAAGAGRRQAPARAALSAELVETIEGATELAVAGRAGERVARLRAADARLAAIARRDALAAGAATVLGSLAAGLTVIAVLAVAIPAVHGGTLAGVLLASLAFLALAAFEGIAPLPLAARRLRACAEAARRIDELCDRQPTVADPEHPTPVPPVGDLALEGVRASYGPGATEVLAGVSLRLAPGRLVALRGPSGAGKTTLAHLLVRFRDVDSGSVTIGGVDVRDVAQEDLRKAVVFAAQDAHLFNTTLRENIQLARRDADEADIWHALESAGAADWACSLADGLDTFVGEDGGVISGGQRQRIALARALLADGRFLILDEPTAHLDAETARRVMAHIAAGSHDRGVLVITHSDAGLEHFDEVLELRGGHIEPTLPSSAS
jgi:thiol reductant ABC exporter CydC subunit